MKASTGLIESVCRWVGTIISIAILFIFLFSLGRYVGWQTGEALNGFGIYHGKIEISWQSPDKEYQASKHPPPRGWNIAEYHGSRFEWLPKRISQRYGEGLLIPLWIPFALFALPSGVLWYRNRRSIFSKFKNIQRRLRPKTRQRITVKQVILFCIGHFIGVLVLTTLIDTLCEFYTQKPLLISSYGLDWVLPVFGLGTPIWAILWTWLFVRYRNHLLHKFPRNECRKCGYDLTGNLSGICSECGQPVSKPMTI